MEWIETTEYNGFVLETDYFTIFVVLDKSGWHLTGSDITGLPKMPIRLRATTEEEAQQEATRLVTRALAGALESLT